MTYIPPDSLQEAIQNYDKAMKAHNVFVRNFERRERSYRGVLKSSSTAAKWRHQMHPPYAFNMIETIVSSTVEMGLDVRCRPAPRVGMSQEEAQHMLTQSEVVRNLIKHEHLYDKMDRKQRPIFLCDSIGGRGIGKTHWNWTSGSVKRQGITDVIVHDDEGNELGTVPQLTEIETDEVLFDNSTTEVVDPRDFIVHESARGLQPREPGGAQHVFHRSWYSMEQLRQLQREGFLKNVDKLTETLQFHDEYSDREQTLWNVNRTKDLVEVLEYWCYKQGKVWRQIIGNRVIELRAEEANPFWHQQYPFFVCSSQPNPFTINGTSDMELIEQLQEMLWELTNQRLDNLELINNAIMLIRSDVDDPDAFQYYPGAHWEVDDPKQVEPLLPPYQLATVSLEAEALLKSDLQAVTSAAPLAGGSDQGVGNAANTATGASLIMNAAQQRLAAKKWQAQQGLVDEMDMRLKNCQQFISDKRLLHILGPSGKMTFQDITPLDIQGEFLFGLTAVSESMNRSERRAEAQAILQVVMDAIPVAAAAGSPIDFREVLLWAFRRWDMEDEAAAFLAPKTEPNPQALAELGGGGGGGSGSPVAPGGQNMGTTAETAVDASSPSATGGTSMSGQQFYQRAKALSGGLQGR